MGGQRRRAGSVPGSARCASSHPRWIAHHPTAPALSWDDLAALLGQLWWSQLLSLHTLVLPHLACHRKSRANDDVTLPGDHLATQAVVSGRRDPGYLETSRIALEAGLCLALQGEELKEKGMLQGGVLTPASAMGSVLIERLRAANIQFQITKTGKEVPTSPLDKLKASSAAARGATAGADKGGAGAGSSRQQASAQAMPAWWHQGGLHGHSWQVPHWAGLEHAHPAMRLIGSACRCGAQGLACAANKQRRILELQAGRVQQQVVRRAGRAAEHVLGSIGAGANRVVCIGTVG
jgi:hypothetical protein